MPKAKLAVTPDKVTKTLNHILVEVLACDDTAVTPLTHLIDDLGADSLDLVEIVMAVEAAFDLQIPDDECDQFKTVQDLDTYVREHQTIKV